jgi:hypothetical protein
VVSRRSFPIAHTGKAGKRTLSPRKIAASQRAKWLRLKWQHKPFTETVLAQEDIENEANILLHAIVEFHTSNWAIFMVSVVTRVWFIGRARE